MNYGSVPIISLVIILGATPLAASGTHEHGGGHEANAWQTIMTHYEGVRDSLLHDRIDGVAEHAASIVDATQKLSHHFDPEMAGVRSEGSSACQELLPTIGKTAKALAATENLETTRAAFDELSKPLVEYRELVDGERPVVVYCAMEKKSWLQPDGEIGNPYFGQQMATCGEVVSK